MPTDKPLPDVWANRDFPVLVEVTRRIDEGANAVRPGDVASAIGMDREKVQRAAASLARTGRAKISTSGEGTVLFIFDVSPEAYVLTGLHPDGDDAVERLASLLNQAAAQAATQEERTRLQRAASAVGELAGTVGAGVMTAYLTSLLPH